MTWSYSILSHPFISSNPKSNSLPLPEQKVTTAVEPKCIIPGFSMNSIERKDSAPSKKPAKKALRKSGTAPITESFQSNIKFAEDEIHTDHKKKEKEKNEEAIESLKQKKLLESPILRGYSSECNTKTFSHKRSYSTVPESLLSFL